MFEPFENDHQSMQIGELIFENQTDKVIVYGDIDIMKSKTGLQQALALQKTVTDIVDALQIADKQALLQDSTHPDTAPKDGENDIHSQVSKTVDNPFS